MMRNLSRAGIVLVVLSALLIACGNDDETPTLQPADDQTASHPAWLTDPNEPPKNPYLADSVWSTAHRNSYCQGSSPYAGPSEPPVGEIEDYIPGRPVCMHVLFSSPYPDGSRVIWGASSRFHVFKADPNGQQLRYIDRLPTAEMQADPMTNEMVDSLGKMKAKELADLMDQTYPQEKSESGAEPGMSGVYYLLDKDNIFYQPRGKTIYAYGDKIEGDRLSPIDLKRSWTVPDDKFPRSDDFLFGVLMTYDGKLVFYSVFGMVGVVDRSLDPDTAQFVQLPEGDYIANQVACDENGGIYIVTEKRMHRVQWTGKELTLDPTKGAWSAEYEGAVIEGRKEGSGASPSLMGVRDQDKFVVITDGARIMNLVLFWRDEIPDDWEQMPGTKDRRIAAQVPVTYGFPDIDLTWSEQSVLVRGYSAFVVNDVLKKTHPNIVVNVVMSGEPDWAPYGCEKFTWDPQTRQLKSDWSNQEISIPNCVPTMSSASSIAYVIGQREGMWTLEAIDWDTGESAWYYEIGDKSRHNSAYAAIEIGPDGTIYYSTFWGIMRIRPSVDPLPSEVVASTSETKPITIETVESSAHGGISWSYNVNYGKEDTVWSMTVIGEETIDGTATYITETSFNKKPKRAIYVARMDKDMTSKFKSTSTWLSKNTLQPVKNEFVFTMMGIPISTKTTFAYDGPSGAPLSVGKTWSYEQLSTPSMGDPTTKTWNAEVVGMEKVTIPAGTYNCYKVVHTAGDSTRTEWWSADGGLLTPVKMVDEASWSGPENHELASYTQKRKK